MNWQYFRITDDRVRCCVPGCKRTRKPNGWPEWICSVHWPLVSKRTKQRWKTIKKVARRCIKRDPLVTEYWKMKPGSPERIRAIRMWGLHETLWQRCKREAIERAVGI